MNDFNNCLLTKKYSINYTSLQLIILISKRQIK